MNHYRSDVYEFFDRKGALIGVKAYLPAPYYNYIDSMLSLKESFDNYYGKDMLVKLVDAEMAGRFDSALRNLKNALKDTPTKEDIKNVAMRCEICRRGLLAMRKQVEDNKLYAPPWIWVGDHKENQFGIVREWKDVSRAEDLYKEATIYAFEEVCAILADHKKTKDVKAALRVAGLKGKVVSVKEKETNEEFYDDDIPF